MMYWVSLHLPCLKTVVGIELTILHSTILNRIPYNGGKVKIFIICHILKNNITCILITDLGCSFLTEQCTNQSVFPYLCNTSEKQLVCTYDHLTKVCMHNYNNTLNYLLCMWYNWWTVSLVNRDVIHIGGHFKLANRAILIASLHCFMMLHNTCDYK